MNKVHILVNSFSARLGGGQTYLINLLNNLKESDGIRVTLLAAAKSSWNFNNKNIEIVYINAPVTNPIIRFFWETMCLRNILEKFKPDIMFCPGGIISSVKITNCKVVTMFRNMMPFDETQINKYPFFSLMRLRLRILNYLMLKSMERADLVIFISNYAKEVVLNISKKGLKKYIVIPHGVGGNFQNEVITHSESNAYMIYPSTFGVYKSQLEVVEAYRGLVNLRKENTPLLYLAGSGEVDYNRKVKELVSKIGLEDKIKFLGHIPYSEMPQMYKNAKIVIFASQTENCPNILLESLAAAKPIVCSNMPPMPEFGGDAVIYFDPRDPQELTNVLNNLLDNPEKAKDLAKLALDRSKNYSWEKCVDKTWNEFKKLMRQEIK